MRDIKRIAIFLSIVIVFLYIANLVVYEALSLSFGITTTTQLTVLGLFLGLLPAGFIGMMIAGSYYYNWFTRLVYTTLAVYMGTFSNLFFASALYGLLLAVGKMLPILYPSADFGRGLFAVAILISAYGVVHAKSIIPARYSVILPHLPDVWKNKKAVWISDIHLGQIHGPRFAKKVTAAVMKENADIIFVGGDLFDGTQAPNVEMLSKPFKEMTAPWGVFYITGNHEEFSDNSAFLHAVTAAGMRIVMDENIDMHGVQLLGVDYHNANDPENFKKILSHLNIDKNKPSLLLKHEPNHLEIPETAGVNLQISGHTHYGQQWPFGLLAQMSYKGYAYGLKPYHAMHMLTSSGVGSWGPPVRIGSNSEIVVITFE